jgi:hypothetical protein
MFVHRHFSLLRRLSLPLAASAIAACSAGGGVGPGTTTSALTEGRVSSDTAAGTMVRAYSVEPDGSYEPASEPAETSADGTYQLDVTLSASSVALLVRMEDDSERATLLSRGAVEAAGSATIQLAPIDARSTVRASVYTAAVAEASADADANLAVDAFVSPELIARVSASADADAAIAATASAVVGARATFAYGLSAQLDGSARGDVQAAFDASAHAELAFAAALDASTSDEETRVAYDAYVDATVDGMIEAGFAESRVAAAAAASETALEANLTGIASDGHAELETFMAAAISTSVEAGAGAELADPGIAAASASLRTTLRWAAVSGVATEEAAAWSDYRASLDAAVTTHLSLTGTILDTLHADLDAAALTLSSAWAEMGADVSGAARVDAYASYHADVTSTTHAEALTTGGLTSTQASAVLEAMAEIGAAAH